VPKDLEKKKKRPLKELNLPRKPQDFVDPPTTPPHLTRIDLDAY
jgi:hypothetical protein